MTAQGSASPVATFRPPLIAVAAGVNRGWCNDVSTGGTDLKFGRDLTGLDLQSGGPAVVVVVPPFGSGRGPGFWHRQSVISYPLDARFSVDVDDSKLVRRTHDPDVVVGVGCPPLGDLVSFGGGSGVFFSGIAERRFLPAR